VTSSWFFLSTLYSTCFEQVHHQEVTIVHAAYNIFHAVTRQHTHSW